MKMIKVIKIDIGMRDNLVFACQFVASYRFIMQRVVLNAGLRLNENEKSSRMTSNSDEQLTGSGNVIETFFSD